MPDQKISLAERILAKLDAGLLPHVLPEKMQAGYGHDNPCAGCDEPVYPAQVEYAFRKYPDSDDAFRLHIGCLGMWLAELRRRGLVTQDGG